MGLGISGACGVLLMPLAPSPCMAIAFETCAASPKGTSQVSSLQLLLILLGHRDCHAGEDVNVWRELQRNSSLAPFLDRQSVLDQLISMLRCAGEHPSGLRVDAFCSFPQ